MANVRRNKNYKATNRIIEKYSKEDAYRTLDMVNMWIGNVDSKISYSLTFMGVLLGFFLTTSKPIDISRVANKILIKIQQMFNQGIQVTLKSIELIDVISVIILILIYFETFPIFRRYYK